MREILVVDDERGNLILVKHVLEQTGVTVHCAESGEEALVQLRSRAFHLMITDLNMPGLNGLELSLKASQIAPHMPVILFSGDITPDIPPLAEEAGITKVLAKPFRPDEMLEAVKDVLTGLAKRPNSA